MKSDRKSRDGYIDSIQYEDSDPAWFAGSYAVKDPFYPCDPATIIIPVDTLDGMSDDDIVRHIRKASTSAQITHVTHAAFHIEYYMYRTSRADLERLAGRMDVEARYFPLVAAALTRIRMYLERRASHSPRSGYIYLIEGQDCYKIGKSRDVPTRAGAFTLQLPFPVRLAHTIPTTDMVWAETSLHQAYAHCRMNGEWFRLAPGEVEQIHAIQSLNPE